VSMRRPSGLGQDYFHNRPYPATDINRLTPDSLRFLDQPQCTTIEAMVSYPRLVRRICLEVYLQVRNSPPQSSPNSTTNLNLALRTAANIELEIDRWVQAIPVALRPERGASQGTPLKAVKQAPHAKVQKLILVISEWYLYQPGVECELTQHRGLQHQDASIRFLRLQIIFS
jgi:hypothetical protein